MSIKTKRNHHHRKVSEYECTIKPNNGKKYKWQVNFNSNVPPVKDPRNNRRGKHGEEGELKRITTFVTFEEAEDFVLLLNGELRNQDLNLGATERTDYLEAVKLLQDKGNTSMSIREVVADWLTYQNEEECTDTVEECWTQWYNFRVEAGYKEGTLKGHRYTKNKLLNPFLSEPIGIFNKPKCRRELANLLLTQFKDPTSLKNNRTEINLFFKWCLQRGKLNVMPLSGKYEFDIPKPKSTEAKQPFVLTVDQAEALLRIALATDKEFGMFSFFCIGIFAGCRTSEIKNLEWEDIILDDVDEDRVIINADGKLGRRRAVEITDQFKKWLSLCDRSHPIIPKNFTKRRRRLMELVGLRDEQADEKGRSTLSANLPVKAQEKIEALGLVINSKKETAGDTNNFMRYSCASYMWMSGQYDESYITKNFGHSSDVLHSNYVNRRVTKKAGLRFLNLVPSTTTDKIVSFGT